MTMSFDDCIRQYENLINGGHKLRNLRQFHTFLLQGGGPPPKLAGISSLSSILSTPFFTFSIGQEVQASAMEQVIERVNIILSPDDPPLTKLLSCGQYGCTYLTSDKMQVCKLIPFRPHAPYKVGYEARDFAQETSILSKLGAHQLGPRVYSHKLLRVPYLQGHEHEEKVQIGFELPEDQVEFYTVYCIFMERVQPLFHPKVGAIKGVVDATELLQAPERPREDVRVHLVNLVSQAQDILGCELDVADVEWGITLPTRPFTLDKLRLLDPACATLPQATKKRNPE